MKDYISDLQQEMIVHQSIYDNLNSPGYIYVIRDYYGNCKIGKTYSPKQRIKQYITYNAQPLERLVCVYTPKLHDTEIKLHEKFNDKRIHPKREWFLLNEEDIEYIRNI